MPSLIPHPASRPPAVRVTAEAARNAGAGLRLTYALAGDLSAVRLPAPAAPERTDGLWRHTCFEAFIRGETGAAYGEFNFAPNGAWAAYAFGAYRAGMSPAELTPPKIAITADPSRLEMTVLLAPEGLLVRTARLRLGLTAVVEAVDRSLSYFALAHPPGAPDFHHGDGFALALPPLEHP